MTKTVLLKNIEAEYKQELEKLLPSLTADKIIELSTNLFRDIKAKGVSLDDDDEADMLLFQYGTYNWGDELGEHFSFDITRQFTKTNFDMFQLSLTLIFAPSTIESDNSWSSDFNNLEEWTNHIKSTEGYQHVKELDMKSYKLSFTKI